MNSPANVFLVLLGGLALFVFGMELLSAGMQNLASAGMRRWVGTAVKHRWAGLLIGLTLTFLLQSSSASTVLFVSLVQSGVLAFKHTIALILGSMIGTTLTVQLIAFKVTNYALIAVVVGVLLKSIARYRYQEQWASIALGMGLVFYGMTVMNSGATPLKQNPAFADWFHGVVGHPWIAFVVATGFTAIVHSSATTIVLVFSLAAAGFFGATETEIVARTLPLVLGANVGTAGTALTAAVRAERAALRTAVLHAALRLVAGLACMFAIAPLAAGTVWLAHACSPGAITIERMIANSHMLFNVVSVAVFLPFVRPLADLFTWLLPDRPAVAVFPQLIMTPGAAVEFGAEYDKMSEAVRRCLTFVIEAVRTLSDQFAAPSAKQLEILGASDTRLDKGYQEITNHALLLYRMPTASHERELLRRLLSASEVAERLGDDISRSLVRDLTKAARGNVQFSLESTMGLQAFSRDVIDVLESLATAYAEPAQHPPAIEPAIDGLRRRLDGIRRSHFQALADRVPAALKSNELLLDIVSELESSCNKLHTLARLAVQRHDNGSIPA